MVERRLAKPTFYSYVLIGAAVGLIFDILTLGYWIEKLGMARMCVMSQLVSCTDSGEYMCPPNPSTCPFVQVYCMTCIGYVPRSTMCLHLTRTIGPHLGLF